MRFCLVGASAGLGRALAERLAADGHDLVLVASDARDLEVIATDLGIRHPGRFVPLAADLTTLDPDAFRRTVLDALGGVDGLLMIAGFTDTADTAQLQDAALRRVLEVNAGAPIRLINAFEGDLAQGGILVSIGSVASMRPRRNNAVYAAAKSALESYVLSLRHRHAATGLRASAIRMGFLRTRMTFGQRLPLPAASAEQAADFVAAVMDRGVGVVYFPRWWQAISLVLNALPWFVFKRLNF